MTTYTEKSYGHEIKITTFPAGFGDIHLIVELNGHKIRSQVRVSKKDDELEWMIPAIVEKAA